MKLHDILLAILITLMWSSNFVFMKFALVGFTPFVFAFLRNSIVTLLVLPFIRSPKGMIKHALILGLFLGTGHFGFIVWVMSLDINVTTAVIVGQFVVPLTCILSVIFLKEKLGWRKILALIIAFIGVIIFVGTPSSLGNPLGIFLLSLTFINLSIVNIYAKSQLHDLPPINIVGWATMFSSPLILIIMLFVDGNPIDMITSANTTQIICLFASAIFPLLLGNIGWHYLIKKYTVNSIVPFSMLVPIFGSILGVLVFDETFTNQMLAGAAFIMTGVGIIIMRQPSVEELGEGS